MNLDPRLKVLAVNISRLIGESSYKPIDVARKLGVDRSVVSRWMTGERTPTIANLIALASLLDRDLAEFWNGPEVLPATPEQRLMIEYMARMTPEQQQGFVAAAASSVPRKL